MSVPDQTAMNSIIKPEQRHHHDTHQMYSHQHEQQHQQNYYDHYDHHQPNSFAPMDHQGQTYQQPDPQQQWYHQQQQQYSQQQQQQYQYRMPQEQHNYTHHHQQQQQIYGQQMPIQQHHTQQQQPIHSGVKQEQNQHWPEQAAHSEVTQTRHSHTREDGESEEDERSKKVPKPSPSKRKKVKVKSSHHNKMNKKSISSKVKIKTKKEKHNDDGGDESKSDINVSNYEDENLKEVAVRLKKGCECSENCMKEFEPNIVLKHRLNIEELTKTEHDLYMMGVTMACVGQTEKTAHKKERKKLRARYRFMGREVCQNAFLYLENTTLHQIKSIRKHMMDHGVSPRVHGNHKRTPINVLPLDTYQLAIRFLEEYLEKHAIKNKIKATHNHNSTATSGPKQSESYKVVHLQKSISVKIMHEAYLSSCNSNEPDTKIMGYTSFKNLIKERFGHLKFDLEPPDSGPKTPANKKNSDRQNVSNKQVRIFKANIV